MIKACKREHASGLMCIVLCRLVVRVHLAQNNTLWSNVEYSHHKVYAFPFVWCAVYIHFAACSLTTNLQSTIVVLHSFIGSSWPLDDST
jgi:hypothetical protein